MTLLFSAFSNSEGGSSPWARGTLDALRVKLALVRFIPVGTGNTSTLDKRLSRTAVHPRGHGEHSASLHTRRIRSGSSPWARGTHDGTLDAALVNRFIPVGTGNTASGRQTGRKTTVHPRGHGEHARLLHHGISCGGSSPWARGTLSIESY